MSAVNRIVEVSNPAYLNTKHKQLQVEQEGQKVGSIPFEDLHVLILTHPQITISQGVLQQCLVFNVPLIVCNDKHLPTGFLFSPFSNSLHSKVIQCQALAKVPLKKQIWKHIVSVKITHQGQLLERQGKPEQKVFNMSARVKSGDAGNLEAQAAVIYWRKLFGSDFRRDPQLEGINSLLNYGYSILRASTARALAGSGLNTALGVHHHNQYNPFCLADDLMEPARPLVDAIVCELTKDKVPELDQTTKSSLLEIINAEVEFDNRRYFLSHALQRSAKSLADSFQQNRAELFNTLKLSE